MSNLVSTLEGDILVDGHNFHVHIRPTSTVVIYNVATDKRHQLVEDPYTAEDAEFQIVGSLCAALNALHHDEDSISKVAKAVGKFMELESSKSCFK